MITQSSKVEHFQKFVRSLPNTNLQNAKDILTLFIDGELQKKMHS